MANDFFSQSYIIEAIEIYQLIISTDPTFNCDLEGLGCPLLSDYCYEWNVFDWYNKKLDQKAIKSSHYDALSLCYLVIFYTGKHPKELKKGLMWYTSMIEKHKKSVGLAMGCGNLYLCL